MQKHLIPLVLALIFIALSLWAGIAPVDRAVWWAEATPLLIVFTALLLTYPRFKFSNTAYVLMSLWLFMHTVGAKYTFAAVPFDWGNRLLSPLLGATISTASGITSSAFMPIRWRNGCCANARRPWALPCFSGYFSL